MIEVGDMHSTRFSDSHFDVIICGWTLSYSNEPKAFANELLRILKDKGVIAIAVEYSTLTPEQLIAQLGYHLGTKNFERINSVSQILELFNGRVREVYFHHDAPNKVSHSEQVNVNVSSVVTIFSINKTP
jgi:ubiquinone/menaquinone biosynthesis C-methylase UbiE